jgi:hypothetical protein
VCFKGFCIFEDALEYSLDSLIVFGGHYLEGFSGFKAVLVLFEVGLSVLNLENKDSPEPLEQALLEDELIGELGQTLLEEVNQCRLGFLEVSV